MQLDHAYYWTADLPRAVAFYRDTLGLTLQRQEGEAWAEFDTGEVRFALHGVADGQPAPPPGGTVVFRVEDLVVACRGLREQGVVFDEEDGEVPGYARFAALRDPDGNPVQLIEYLHGR